MNLQPHDNIVTDLLSHSLRCPSEVQSTPVTHIPWAELHHYLKRAKPTKAGGWDGSNAYVFVCAPEPIQRFL